MTTDDTFTLKFVPSITKAQYTRAFALGERFSHGWTSVCPLPRDVSYNTPLHELQTLVDRYNDVQETAITRFPLLLTLDERGFVVHTTGSGRLSWSIDPAGNTVVRVLRPTTGECLSAFVSKQGAVTVRVNPTACYRHGEALLEALAALGAHEVACAASPWLAKVEGVASHFRFHATKKRELEEGLRTAQETIQWAIGKTDEQKAAALVAAEDEYTHQRDMLDMAEQVETMTLRALIGAIDAPAEVVYKAQVERVNNPVPETRAPRVVVPPHKLDTKGMSPMEAAKARNYAAQQAFEARKAERAAAKHTSK